MRKIKAVFAIVSVLLVGLAACQKENAGEPTTIPTEAAAPTEAADPTEAATPTAAEQPEQELDLEAVYQAFLDLQTESEDGSLFLFPDDFSVDYYYAGLKELSPIQIKLYTAPVTGFATELMMVEVKDTDQMEQVKKVFQERIALGAADEGYPDSAAIWEKNAKIQTYGNYVAMVVLPDRYVMPENVFELGGSVE